jgi:DNA-binding response OmpR family regulator
MNRAKSKKNPKILIVEDDLESQKYFGLILKKNFEVDFCDSKKSMYTLLSKKDYEVIVMDISLRDGSNGLDLIRELKHNKSHKIIPIICLSAHANSEDKLKAEKAGAEIYLIKPIKGQTLMNALNELVAASLRENN